MLPLHFTGTLRQIKLSKKQLIDAIIRVFPDFIQKAMSSSAQIHPIPAFTDNYIWIFADGEGKACVVDPGDASVVTAHLEQHNLTLSHILLTHHHPDHTGGVKALAKSFDLEVIGPANSPFGSIDTMVSEGQQVNVLGFQFKVLEVPGHTLDHIAYYCDSAPDGSGPLVFCGDTLFAAGCGRIFEGNPVMMFESLQKLANLPATTRVFCTHEYTLANLKFANAADPDNPDLQQRTQDALATREKDQPTLPSNIALELATNPFLRCAQDDLVRSAAAQVGGATSDPVEVFTALRSWKDNF
jgi:hydroxyacylglutathione hydrolase